MCYIGFSLHLHLCESNLIIFFCKIHRKMKRQKEGGHKIVLSIHFNKFMPVAIDRLIKIEIVNLGG